MQKLLLRASYERYRSGIKKVFNAMTFAEKALTRYPKGVKQMFKERELDEQSAAEDADVVED